MNELKQAIRQIRNAPLLSLSIIAVFAIAIGANTAILSALQTLVFRQLPWPGADRMVIAWESNRAQGVTREGVSGSTYLDWKAQARSFEELALVEVGTGTLTGAGEPRQLPGLRVSANFLRMVGAKPALGRIFDERDAGGEGFQPIVILTWEGWRRGFGSDPNVIGRTINLDLQPMTIVGVLSPSFWSPVECEGLVVWPDSILRRMSRSARGMAVFGRMKPGVDVRQAEAELSAISAHVPDAAMKGWSATTAKAQDVMSESLRPSLWALWGAACLVLLSGCANIASLLLARALARRQEVSVRLALGASGARLSRLFLTESALLGLLGWLGGMLVADALLSAAARVLPATIAIREGGGEVVLPAIQLSWPVVLCSALIAAGTALLFGLAPLHEALRTDLRSALTESSRGTTGRGGRLRPALLAAQIAFTLVLLSGASLLLRNFFRLQNADLGFARERILTMTIELPTDSRYRNSDDVRRFYRELRRRLAELPGVESAGFSNVLPLTPAQDHAQFRLETGPAMADDDAYAADFRSVTPGYFETLRIKLLSGRAVSEQDLADKKAVVWIDRTLQQRYFPERDPVGHRILLGNRRQPYEIAGVVASSRHDALRHGNLPSLYFAHEQMPAFRMDLAIRTTADPLGMVAAVKRSVWSVDKDIPVYRVTTMDDLFASSTRNARLVLLLVSVFAAASLLLAAVGTYGVVAYQAETRFREFSIRLALGARPGQLLSLMLRQTAVVTAAGAAVGLLCCFAALRPLQSLLYDLDAMDPLSLAATVALLLVVALLAALRPALRVLRGDAAHSLRGE